MTLFDYLWVSLRTLKIWTRRVLVCWPFGHRYKFGPRGCIRCGKPIPSLRSL